MNELEKWEKYQEAFNIISEFLTFAEDEHGVTLMTEDCRHLAYGEEDDLIFEFFDIDPVKLGEERRELLKKARASDAGDND